MDFSATLSILALLIPVMDPIGNSTMSIAVLRNVDPKKRYKVILREVTIAILLLIFFLFTGGSLLEILQVEQRTLKIAGGIILFIVALRLIFPRSEGIWGETQYDGIPFIFPMATPLLAGPSAIATVILIGAAHPFTVLPALCFMWIIMIIALFLAGPIASFIGKNGISALQRLMGLILVAISVQMFTDGFANYIGSLHFEMHKKMPNEQVVVPK